MKRLIFILIKQHYYILLKITNFILKVLPLSILRICFLNLIGQKISFSSSIHGGVKIMSLIPRSIKIDKRTIINRNVLIDNRGQIIIGKDVAISENCKIFTTSHSHSSSSRPTVKKKTIISDKVFIYSNSIIIPGVKLGEGTVLAAGSVITKDTDDYCLYAGNPAVSKKQINKVNFKNNFYGYFWTP